MKKNGSPFGQIGPYFYLGGVLAGCVAVGALVGRWLDGKLGTKPWCLLGGALFGIAAGFYHFFKAVAQLGKPPRNDGSDGGT